MQEQVICTHPKVKGVCSWCPPGTPGSVLHALSDTQLDIAIGTQRYDFVRIVNGVVQPCWEDR